MTSARPHCRRAAAYNRQKSKHISFTCVLRWNSSKRLLKLYDLFKYLFVLAIGLSQFIAGLLIFRFGCDKFMGGLSVYDIVYCNCFHYECPVFIDGHFAISSLFINFNTRWDFFLLHYTRSLIYISTQPDRRIYLYGQIAIWTSISGTNLHTYI